MVDQQLINNIKDSFKMAKSDMVRLQQAVIDLNEVQKALVERIAVLEARKETNGAKSTPKKKSFVASKEGKKFHIPACPFAQNIKPKSKIIFKTATKALNDGYKACACA